MPREKCITFVDLCFNSPIAQAMWAFSPQLINTRKSCALGKVRYHGAMCLYTQIGFIPNFTHHSHSYGFDYAAFCNSPNLELILGWGRGKLLGIADYYGMHLHNFTPLQAAVFGGNQDVVRFLLTNGADPRMHVGFSEFNRMGDFTVILDQNNPDNISIIALCFMCCFKVEILKDLLQALCDTAAQEIFNELKISGYFKSFFDVTCDIKVNVLDIALRLKNYEALEILLKHAICNQDFLKTCVAWLNKTNDYGETPAADPMLRGLFLKDTVQNKLVMLKTTLDFDSFEAKKYYYSPISWLGTTPSPQARITAYVAYDHCKKSKLRA